MVEIVEFIEVVFELFVFVMVVVGELGEYLLVFCFDCFVEVVRFDVFVFDEMDVGDFNFGIFFDIEDDGVVIGCVVVIDGVVDWDLIVVGFLIVFVDFFGVFFYLMFVEWGVGFGFDFFFELVVFYVFVVFVVNGEYVVFGCDFNNEIDDVGW